MLAAAKQLEPRNDDKFYMIDNAVRLMVEANKSYGYDLFWNYSWREEGITEILKMHVEGLQHIRGGKIDATDSSNRNIEYKSSRLKWKKRASKLSARSARFQFDKMHEVGRPEEAVSSDVYAFALFADGAVPDYCLVVEKESALQKLKRLINQKQQEVLTKIRKKRQDNSRFRDNISLSVIELFECLDTSELCIVNKDSLIISREEFLFLVEV